MEGFTSSLYYIIVDNTGLMLPECKSRNKTAASLTDSLPPRLFKSIKSAKQALNWWLKGVWHSDRDGYLWVDIDTRRIRENMKIIKVILQAVV